ncbi:MAG: redox-regulated ATPase YchF [Candidatus Bipolaricaulia bacterium]
MSLRCGLVGVPACGKTTIYNAITSSGTPMFDAAESHRATVAVPDPRVEALVALYHPAKVVRASVEVVDIPGLSQGSTAEGGRGSRLLTHIKEADALIHVVRCFAAPEHAASPLHDVETIDLELMAADAQTVTRKGERLAKRVRIGDKDAAREAADCEIVLKGLDAGVPVRNQGLTDAHRASIADGNLLSQKPVLYVANIASPRDADGPHVAALREHAAAEGSEVIVLCGRDEADISELAPNDRGPFLAELGQKELSIDRLLHAAYRQLGLVDFFTAGEREVHVWTCRRGDTAPTAAGKIHSDMERGFIRMEVIAYEDLIACGSEAAAAKAGRRRLEGRDYEIQDGDVVVVRFSPPR